MKRLAESVLAQAERARAGAGHSGIKGAAIEFVLRRLLRQYVPTSFSVGTGQVANAAGLLSPQMDVLLYDGAVFPHLSVNEDSSVVVCCESVLAAVESKTDWDGKDIADHFERFRTVDSGRSGWWASQADSNAAYFVFVLERLVAPSLALLQDPKRSVGVYSLKGQRCWHSRYADNEFSQEDGNALELFLSHVLQDCMRKGPVEIGTFEESYSVVARYFGWKEGDHPPAV